MFIPWSVASVTFLSVIAKLHFCISHWIEPLLKHLTSQRRIRSRQCAQCEVALLRLLLSPPSPIDGINESRVGPRESPRQIRQPDQLPLAQFISLALPVVKGQVDSADEYRLENREKFF